MKPEFMTGHTFHKRIGAIANSFRYGVDYVLLNLDDVQNASRLFSHDKFNIAAVHNKDHGGKPKSGKGAEWVRQALCENDLEEFARMEVLLLTQPRILGYVFNPVSFWFIVKDDELYAVIAEVNNTYGDRHSYLCHRDDRAVIEPSDTLHAKKLMHVSPYQPIAGSYSFRFKLTKDYVGVRIDLDHPDGGIITTLAGKRSALTSGAILKSILKRPIGSIRVIGLIYYQALVLRIKGAKFLSRPNPPKTEISR